MPWYSGNIPTEWASAVERLDGGKFITEILFDPDGINIVFDAKYDVLDIRPISIIKDLDPEFGITPTISDITITLNDPDDYFNDKNTNSVFYNYSPIGKTIIVRLVNLTETTLQTITVFAGRIAKNPSLSLGSATLYCADKRKYILNQKLTGADSSTAKKLMTINQAGGLSSSVTYSNTWNASPYDFELSGGSLPTGLSVGSTGSISGTPTESGTFNFTIKATNANGEYHSIDCSLYIDPDFNNHFTSAGGLGDYTQVDKGTTISLAANESWCRVTMNGNYEWDADSDNAPHVYITGASGLSGDWTLYGKVKNGFDGQNANYSGIYIRIGTYDGFICGCKSTATPGSFTAAVYRANDSNNIHNTAIVTDTIWVKIKKVSTTYYFYYRTADSGSWTTLTNATRAGTPTQVGFMVMADVTGNGYGEIDQLYYQYGDLAITTSASLPTAAKNEAYSAFVKSTGGGGEYSYSVTTGSLPDGLALTASTGEISGTPIDARVSSFSITSTDGNGGTMEEDFALEISDLVYIVPSILPDGIINIAYSDQFEIYGSGTIDRTEITIGSKCALGKWKIEFTNVTDYNISGPGVSNSTGSTDEDFEIEDVIIIPTTAWDGNFRKNDSIEFVTGISYENINAVSLFYNLYIYAGIENKYLNCSSFFGDKEIGVLYEDAAASETSIKVKVDVPTKIKTNETLTIAYSGTSEIVTITTGNAESTSFPPYITFSVSALSNSFPAGASVTWNSTGTKDIDYSFDEFWNYCNLNNFNISITFDREINILEALELTGIHAGIYVMHSSGVERVAGLIKRWTEDLTEIGDSVILKNSVNVDTMEIFNSFKANYGYNYSDQKFTKTLTYPTSDASNDSYIMHGYKREKIIDLPGYYSPVVVETLLGYLYNIFSDGLNLIDIELDLKALRILTGERYDLNSSHPDIETEIEVYGYTLNLLNKYSIILKTVERAHITEAESQFLLMPDGNPLTMPNGEKTRRPETW